MQEAFQNIFFTESMDNKWWVLFVLFPFGHQSWFKVSYCPCWNFDLHKPNQNECKKCFPFPSTRSLHQDRKYLRSRPYSWSVRSSEYPGRTETEMSSSSLRSLSNLSRTQKKVGTSVVCIVLVRVWKNRLEESCLRFQTLRRCGWLVVRLHL